MPRDIQAFSVSRACATSFQAMTSAAEAMLAGQCSVAIAGGADSASDVPITMSKPLARSLLRASKASTWADRVKAFGSLSLKDLLPVPPAAREPSTGLLMGESAEKMAKEAGIAREDQDAYAHGSHQRAAKAWESGVFVEEVMHVVPPPTFDRPIASDNVVRKDSTPEEYAKLKPAFDAKYGTVTAGNSSPLTDGASALLLMTESRAKALGYEPLGFLRSWAYSAVDPKGWMLTGPAYAAPKALDAAGIKMRDVALVDMHEAFAAQVLCNLKLFGSKKFAQTELGRGEAVGEVDAETLQRPRRLDRHRAPVRGHRRPHRHDRPSRAAPPRRGTRACDRLRCRRPRRRDRRRGGVVSAVATSPERGDETIVTIDARRDGVAFIALNHPSDPHNTITPALAPSSTG